MYRNLDPAKIVETARMLNRRINERFADSGLSRVSAELLSVTGVAIFFLFTLEARIKRGRALKAIHVLRSIAHIIDMHQLTKDPERVANPSKELDTQSSPTRTLTPFLLTRYLDYCSEALSVISKVAALYVQKFDDPVTLSAVNDVEDLTNGLSRKIWQKIMMLDRLTPAVIEGCDSPASLE